MEQAPKRSSKTRKIVAFILIMTIAVVVLFAALTYPRVVLSFNVFFTVGEIERKAFDVPFLHSWVQLEVRVTSGTALWTVQILKNDETVWTHATTQGGQTTYTSEWIPLEVGHYNLTFGAVGIGSVDADVSITSKDGFW